MRRTERREPEGRGRRTNATAAGRKRGLGPAGGSRASSLRRNDCSALARVFESWRQYVARYSNEVTWECNGARCRDAIFWTTERANVGALAAATCLSGGLAVEEYGEKKRWGRRAYSGRVDLFVRTKNGDSFAIEAKLKWVRLGARCKRLSKHAVSVAKDLKAEAAAANHGIPPEHGVTRLGLVFIVPSLAGARLESSATTPMWEGDDRSEFNEFIRDIVTATGCFVEEAWLDVPAVDPSSQPIRRYPGVVALGLRHRE